MDKETMKEKRKGLRLKGQMKQYLKWPAYYNAFWLIITVVMFAVDIKAGIFMITVRFKGICFVKWKFPIVF